MADYSEGKIYLIKFRNDPSLVYVGSTIQSLNKRFRKDKYQHTSLYKYIDKNHNGNWDDCYIELYEDYPCLNEKELERREGEITLKFKNNSNYNCINKNIAGRTMKEYYEDNKDKILEYYENNKEKINEKHKEYYENNKEKLKEYQKEYQKQKITCSCGSIIRLDSKSRHLKTQKHLASL